jgi:Uma2 family endonuclease
MVTSPSSTLSFAAYLTYDDGTDNRYELVDGLLTLMNPPSIEHFLITKFLEQTFDREIQRQALPWLTLREAGVRTGFSKSRITDLCIVSKDQARELTGQSAVFQTPPLLVVEVVSPESVTRDYRYKRSEYAAASIPEYWIVDPLEQQITILEWQEGFYEARLFRDEQTLISPTLPQLQVTANSILAASNIS